MREDPFQGDDFREAFDASLLGDVKAAHPTFTQHAADAVAAETLAAGRGFMSLDPLHVALRSSDVRAPDLEPLRAFNQFVCIERVARSRCDGYSQKRCDWCESR